MRELPYIGYHGYDNVRYKNMYGIYFATGPGVCFKILSALMIQLATYSVRQ